ncbi:MAG TPA: serine/threonine-protein kinase [Candidatus Obscuribacterales bacterium]
MTTAVQHFLGNLKRTLSASASVCAPGQIYKVTAVAEPFVGKRLTDCEVLERVGQGAMSVVYKARQDITERLVALKMLRVQLCCDPSNVKRFQREARALSRLHHANLLNVYHVGVANTGQPFIVMDYVQGRSLGDLLQAEKRIAWPRAAKIFRDVCDAMEHAHQQGVIHRDLKPDNIMLVDDRDAVKIVDFGIVKITDESQRLSQKLTQKGEVWGSPVYMSPEQCQGRELDPRTDIYSLGTVMFECLTGQQLFNAKNFTELVMKQLTAEPEAMSKAAPGIEIPLWLEAAVRKALSKDPLNRFQSMAEFRDALKPPNAHAAADAAKLLSAPRQGGPIEQFLNLALDGGYCIKSFIGQGGMSLVFKAVQEGTDRVVAVKVLKEELACEDSYVKRFEREAKSLARLSHPGLVSIYDIGRTEHGQPYMVIEYLEGTTIHDWIIDNGKMTVQQALPIFVDVCDVMNYAHKQGIIHRDVKPHNIMLVKQGRRENVVKVVDFGIVKLDENIVSVSQKLTASGEICGSPMYMSPEQILDDPLDNRTDIYSLGIVMYEVLSGRPLFGGSKITEVMNKHVNMKPQPLTVISPDSLIPDRLDAAVRRCLEKNRERRFQSMSDLKQELTDINLHLDQLTADAKEKLLNPPAIPSPEPATTSGAAPKRPAPKMKSASGGGRSNILLAACALLLIASALGGFWLMQNAHKPSTQDEAAGSRKSLHDDYVRSERSPGLLLEHKPVHTRHKHHGLHGSNETLELMETTEKAHLQHNSGAQKDPYKGLPE